MKTISPRQHVDNRGLFFSVHRCRDQISANNSIGVRVEQSTLGFLQKYSFFFYSFFFFDRHTDDKREKQSIYYAIYYSEYSCRKFFFFFRFHTFSHYILAFLVLVLSRRRPLRFFPPEQRKQTNFSFFPYLRGSFSSRRALGDREFCNNINTNFSNSIDHRFFHHF